MHTYSLISSGKTAAFLPVATMLTALTLAGCQTGQKSPPIAQRTNAAGLGQLTINNPDTAPPEPRLAPARSNITVVSYSGPHGTQVAYHSPNGKVYLWYPGNTEVLKGDWKTAKPFQMCYRYDSRSLNPHAQQPGGRWVCRHALMMSFGLGAQHERKGDVFGLATRNNPPFVSRKGKEQLDEILAKLPPATPQDKPSRISQVFDSIRSEEITAADERLWQQVGQPPAGGEASPPPNKSDE